MLWLVDLLRRTLIPARTGRRLRFEQKPITAVIKADIEAIRAARGRGGGRGGAARGAKSAAIAY